MNLNVDSWKELQLTDIFIVGIVIVREQFS